MTGFWPIFFLLVVLKIPVLGSIWLVWWASREPEPDTADGTEGGFERRRPQPEAARAAPAAGRTAAAPRRHSGLPAGRAGPVSSSRLRSLLSLAPELAQIGIEVDLDRMTLRGDEALLHPSFLARNRARHLRRRRQRRAA